MSEDDVVENEALTDVIKQRTAALNRKGRKKSLQPQQIVGILGFVVLLVGGIGYMMVSADGGSLSGATPRNFDQPRSGNPNLSIARPSVTEPEPAAQVAVAAPPALPAFQPPDNSDDLARLNKLTTEQAEAQRIIDELTLDLDNAVEAITLRDERIGDLSTRVEKEEARYTKLQRESDNEGQRMRNRISALEGQLQVANSRNNLSPVSGNDADADQLKNARERRQLQIESQGVIFDGSDETNTIRY